MDAVFTGAAVTQQCHTFSWGEGSHFLDIALIFSVAVLRDHTLLPHFWWHLHIPGHEVTRKFCGFKEHRRSSGSNNRIIRIMLNTCGNIRDLNL